MQRETLLVTLTSWTGDLETRKPYWSTFVCRLVIYVHTFAFLPLKVFRIMLPMYGRLSLPVTKNTGIQGSKCWQWSLMGVLGLFKRQSDLVHHRHFWAKQSHSNTSLASLCQKKRGCTKLMLSSQLLELPVSMFFQWLFIAPQGITTSSHRFFAIFPPQLYFEGAVFNVVKGHAKNLSIAFAFIIEAADEDELPETVLSTFELHKLDLELCEELPPWEGSAEDWRPLDTNRDHALNFAWLIHHVQHSEVKLNLVILP